MKFKDMPYQRVEYERAEHEYRRIIEDFRMAESGEEQFKLLRLSFLHENVDDAEKLSSLSSIGTLKQHACPLRFSPGLPYR